MNKKYNKFAFIVNNKNEFRFVQEYLSDNNYVWMSRYSAINYFPQIIWVYYNNKKINISIFNDDFTYSQKLIDNYIEHNNNTYEDILINPIIFNYIDITSLPTIFRYGITHPTYKPKKIDRNLNEGLNNNNIIYVYCDSHEKSLNFEELLHSYDFIWIGLTPKFILKNATDFTFNDITFYINIKEKTFDGYTVKRLYDIMYYYPEDKLKILQELKVIPSYKPKKIKRGLNESIDNILWVFDMDDTLVFSKRFEDEVRPLLNEDYTLTPEMIFRQKINEIGIDIDDLYYEDGRIYFNDPLNKINIPKKSSWVRKKDRIYLIQPDTYLLTDESMPNEVNEIILDLYNKAEFKSILTNRSEKIKNKTIESLKNLGIEMPNMGLFMYPDNYFSLKNKWKSDKLIELYNSGFNEVRYYDNNIKSLKKIKTYLKTFNLNIRLFKVKNDKYEEI